MFPQKLEGVLKVDGLPIVQAGFNWSVGALMQEFIKSLEKKKLLGIKCPNCGWVHAPPRTRCMKCNTKTGADHMLELKGEGTLVSHTVAHVQLDGKGNFVDLKEPKVIGAVKLDGVDSTWFLPIEGDPKALKPGQKVAIVWSDKPKGSIADIKAFKPAK